MAAIGRQQAIMDANGISLVREILCDYCDLQLFDLRRYQCPTEAHFLTYLRSSSSPTTLA
jgi:hypothetical protein